MAVQVGINGFGRIGRLAFRQMFGHEGSELRTEERVPWPLWCSRSSERESSDERADYGRYNEVYLIIE